MVVYCHVLDSPISRASLQCSTLDSVYFLMTRAFVHDTKEGGVIYETKPGPFIYQLVYDEVDIYELYKKWVNRYPILYRIILFLSGKVKKSVHDSVSFNDEQFINVVGHSLRLSMLLAIERHIFNRLLLIKSIWY